MMTHTHENGTGAVRRRDAEADARVHKRVHEAKSAEEEAHRALERVSKALEEAARKWAENEPVPQTWEELFGGKR